MSDVKVEGVAISGFGKQFRAGPPEVSGVTCWYISCRQLAIDNSVQTGEWDGSLISQTILFDGHRLFASPAHPFAFFLYTVASDLNMAQEE